MADTKTTIEQAYAAFNQRDIDAALALMTPDVRKRGLIAAMDFGDKTDPAAGPSAAFAHRS